MNADKNPMKTWADFLQHSVFWRKQVKRSFGDSIGQLHIIPSIVLGGRQRKNVLLGLGSINAPDGNSSFQTIVYNELEAASNGCLELRPLLDVDDFDAPGESNKPPAELVLHFERLRGQIGNGVTEYAVDEAKGRVFVSTATKLYRYEQTSLQQICVWSTSAPLNFQFSPVDSDFVAFTSNGRLFIDQDNHCAFVSEYDAGFTCGVSSFVVQEELERDKGFWWSPNRTELVYERVDENAVMQLHFTAPGKAEQAPMRYPRAGTANALSSLHLVYFDEGRNSFVDKVVLADVKKLGPLYEYISRCFWSPEGDRFFIVLLDRLQENKTVLVVERDAMLTVGESDVLPHTIIYTESSSIWLNHDNLTNILPSENGTTRVLYGSEKKDHAHVYMDFYEGGRKLKELPVTSGAWSVLKEAPLVVDCQRGHVYFLANYSSVLRTSLCVTSYDDIEHRAEGNQVQLLTPPEMSYKYDRCDSVLCLNPEVGFVCWLSNTTTLPECSFYSLHHDPANAQLPRAEYRFRIRLQSTPTRFHSASLNPDSPLNPANASPALQEAEPMSPEPSSVSAPLPALSAEEMTALYRREFFETPLPDGPVLHSMLLWPTNRPGPLPLIQYVYGGPGLQIVRDSWMTVSQHLKYVVAGYAVLLVDNRGSANRGIQFEGHVKHALGHAEIYDQVFVLKDILQRSNGLLDPKRVAVHGWSYGGFMSLLLLANFPQVYRCACAGGAVVDWRLYDTCYTERYMGMPLDKKNEYVESSVLACVEQLPDEEDRLLVVHGLMDENVHFLHTEKLIQKLMLLGKPHRLLLFPSERHGVRKAEAVEYLHANMFSFFKKLL